MIVCFLFPFSQLLRLVGVTSLCVRYLKLIFLFAIGLGGAGRFVFSFFDEFNRYRLLLWCFCINCLVETIFCEWSSASIDCIQFFCFHSFVWERWLLWIYGLHPLLIAVMVLWSFLGFIDVRFHLVGYSPYLWWCSIRFAFLFAMLINDWWPIFIFKFGEYPYVWCIGG